MTQSSSTKAEHQPEDSQLELLAVKNIEQMLLDETVVKIMVQTLAKQCGCFNATYIMPLGKRLSKGDLSNRVQLSYCKGNQ